jgi:hypothetical protein
MKIEIRGIPSKVKLTGKTHKGKNRVRELGEIWNVLKIGRPVALVDPGRPEALFIAPVDHPNDARWVEMPPREDPDFTVEIVEISA